MPDINLLPQEEKTQESVDSVRKKLSVASIALLSIAAVSTILTLIFFSVFASQQSSLVVRRDEAASKINNLKSTEELIVVIKGKASTADKVIGARTDLNSFFTTLASIVPQGVAFSDFKLQTNKVVISGKARSSSDMAGLAGSLVTGKGADIFSNVSVDSLSSADGGVYSFILSAQLATSKPAASSTNSVPSAPVQQ